MKKTFPHYRALAKKYHFLIVDISEGDEEGYRAVIPKFPGMYIFADTPKELREVVEIMIAEELQYLEKKNRPTPTPDKIPSSFSGKFILRLDPAVHERLTCLSQAEGKTLNGYISGLLEEWVGGRRVTRREKKTGVS